MPITAIVPKLTDLDFTGFGYAVSILETKGRPSSLSGGAGTSSRLSPHVKAVDRRNLSKLCCHGLANGSVDHTWSLGARTALITGGEKVSEGTAKQVPLQWYRCGDYLK
jgi:hypothetical protein